MHEARALRVRVRPAQGAQHAVDMSRGAGAALHRKPHRFVEHQHIVVFVERDLFEKEAVLLRRRRVVARLGRVELERRDAHRLPCFEPRLRLGALAVHTHLAFADDALDVTERQAGKSRLEEAIDPHVVLVRRNIDVLHAGGKLRSFQSVILRCEAAISAFTRTSQRRSALADLRTRIPISGKPEIGG